MSNTKATDLTLVSTIHNDLFPKWIDDLREAKCLELLDDILPKLDILYENTTVYPLKPKVFRVFKRVAPKSVKVIILGQDPYHSFHNGMPDACGYSFLTENRYYPPSLKNMFKELQEDENATTRDVKGALKRYLIENYPFDEWIQQGVLMLNTALTVEDGLPGSHFKIWERWSERLIKHLVNTYPDIVWILLGNKAQACLRNYDCRKVEATHPSPLAGGKFFGSRIYSKTNELLRVPIVW